MKMIENKIEENLVEKPATQAHLESYLEWYTFILQKMELWWEDLGEPKEILKIKEGADEVFRYACKTEKSPGIFLEKYKPLWQPSFHAESIDIPSFLSTLVETWVIHVALKFSTPGSSSVEKLVWKKPKILIYLAVSPTYHYRLLLGQFWPDPTPLELHEQIMAKNLLSTSFSPREIQDLSAQIWSDPKLSENLIWQHTYRMRLECATLIYQASGYPLQKIYEEFLKNHSRKQLGKDLQKKIEGAYFRLKHLEISYPPSLSFL